MACWKGCRAAKENIRLFAAAKTWRRCADEIDGTTGEAKERGNANLDSNPSLAEAAKRVPSA
ncbi:hypothetical protein SAMN05216228_11224 [Rhizobium tibeticum]|uniref:Uncharacterized protein n=1 Tax=Rhizobium tibeticum TaxID=501024 RepID=A0A1H8X9W1_9HYPH|nr:hypothetical protein [Rhizobium tibeticum]SEI22772.1 hypothetical protein RTCCBAU85039_6911 [Rhizobium tibeticum]SEP36642.1 hypothetical protein SAMN05216228_11224 [Rhizobium tibeticum]